MGAKSGHARNNSQSSPDGKALNQKPVQNTFIFNGKVIFSFHLEAIWVEALTRVVIQVGGQRFQEDFVNNTDANKKINEIIGA